MQDMKGNPQTLHHIEFSPALDRPVLLEAAVSNWKDNQVAETDFRLRRVASGYEADSPAIGMGENGSTVGWEANLPVLRRSDFDGDGLIDDARYR